MSCVGRRVAELFGVSPRAVGELEAGKWGGQPAARGDLGFGGGAQMGGGGGSARGEVPPGAFGRGGLVAATAAGGCVLGRSGVR